MDMENLILQKLTHFLKSLSDIPDEEIQEFYKHTSVNKYKSGDFFCRSGEPTQKMGVVLSGIFRVYYRKDKNIYIRTFCTEGQPMASYATLLTSQNAHVDIEAIEDSAVLEISFPDFISFYKRHPSWEKFGRKTAENMYVKRENREFQLLTMDALQRYELFLEEFPGLADRITQANIASYLGISPVSLSRLLKDRKKD